MEDGDLQSAIITPCKNTGRSFSRYIYRDCEEINEAQYFRIKLHCKMISEANQCFPRHHPQVVQLYEGVEDLPTSSGAAAPAGSDTLLYSLSVLRDKFQQLQSLVGAVVRPDRTRRHSAAAVVSGAGALIQEIIVAASSMMYPIQQVALGAGDAEVFNVETHYSDGATSPNISNRDRRRPESPSDFPPAAAASDIIELEAADLLGKYTHYCHVCGKGFKRDANLRMHMRSHGDEYKTAAALCNPAKGGAAGDEECSPFPPAARKYSCPEEGCRWNRGHARFQPLKSVVCVKNHYRRSHCPKLHVCRRCERKRFSVLSDLRTHEKHCGDRKWRCTCGTTFSRKDKLMGHVALFAGHGPASDRSMVQGEE